LQPHNKPALRGNSDIRLQISDWNTRGDASGQSEI